MSFIESVRKIESWHLWPACLVVLNTGNGNGL